MTSRDAAPVTPPLDGNEPGSARLALARMAVSRHAADLFWEHGVAATSGDDIARAAGVSTRTVWRYFRSKESCVEPLLAASAYRFIAPLERWPASASLEDYLRNDLASHPPTDETLIDDIRSVQLIALSMTEPAIRTAWLMACGGAEDALAAVVARRLNRPITAPDVRLCAAAVAAAVRVVNEEVAIGALREGRQFTSDDVISRLAEAIGACTRDFGFVDPAA